MGKNMVDFLNGATNVLEANVIITREYLPNGVQFINIKKPGEDIPFYTFWHNPKKVIKKEKPPKHTGGKKPYLMLMVEEIAELKKQGVKNVEEMIGYLVCLGRYIEWNTGRLVQKRTKKPLRYNDLLRLFGCSTNKFNKLLASMKEHEIIFGTEEGYFISGRFIKKGKAGKKGGL